MSELATIPPKETAMDVYTAVNGLEPYLAEVKEKIDEFEADVSTAKGRKAIASMAHKVSKTKTALDSIGKDLVAELKQKPKLIDAERKRMRETLDKWRDEVRAPLTEWEEAEAARQASHQAGIETMKSRLLQIHTSDSEDLRELIRITDETIVDDRWEEFELDARRTKRDVLSELKEALAAREKYEAEQAELERLRAEAAERELQDRIAREAKEAQERAKAEAEEASRQEREAALAREQELKQKAEQAEEAHREAVRRAEQAEADAKAKAEREIEEAKQREEEERKQREADREHKSTIMRQAKEGFMAAGIDEPTAKKVVLAIVSQKIPNVSINF